MILLRLPNYLKYVIILLGLILFFYTLKEASAILIPLSIALLLSLLLLPLCNFLERHRFSRGTASFVSIVIVLVGLGIILFFLYLEIVNISRDFPSIRAKVDERIESIQLFLQNRFGVDKYYQSQYIEQHVDNLIENSGIFISNTLTATAGVFAMLALVGLSMFFMLYYRSFFKEFLYKLFPGKQHFQVMKVIESVKVVVQKYISGVVIVIGILLVLNSLTLIILGISYPIFWGVITALLAIIPYVGVFIGSTLVILYTLVSTDSLFYPLAVLIVFWVIQLVEGNLITPNVVGGKVSLNPFVAIIALFIGGELWGAAGMILFIPMLAILKVIFDVIEPLKPIGFLLGVPPEKPTGIKRTKNFNFFAKKRTPLESNEEVIR